MIKVQGHRLLILLDPIKVEVTEIPGFEIVHANKNIERSSTQRGLVVATGSQCFLAFRQMDDRGNEVNGEAWCKTGDYITFAQYAGRSLLDPEDKENDFIVINDMDIICINEKGKNVIPDNDLRDEVISRGVEL